MKRSAPLKRSTKPLRRRKHPQVRVGKHTGKVRLSGAALSRLRIQCFERDQMWCQQCSRMTLWKPRFDGDPQAYDMAHIISRGAGGSDTLDNVRTLCHSCHMAEHNKGKAA